MTALPTGPKPACLPLDDTGLKWLLFASMTVMSAAALAAGPDLAASPSYRLKAEGHDAFRLAAAPAASATLAARLAERPFAAQIDDAARKTNVDPALVHAVIYVESRYQPAARSPKGAMGLMQVLPETASRYGVSNAGRSVEANLSVGTRYLSDLMRLFDGRLELALAAYNAGENTVLRYGHRIPPYRETQQYVPAVLEKYREWQDPRSAAAARRRVEYLPGTLLNSPAPPPLRP